MTTTVAVRTCNTYHLGEVQQALERCISLLGFELPSRSSVLIKPNAMSNNRPEQATATHHAVVEATCRLLADRGCRIAIGDSSAYYFPGFTRGAFAALEFDRVARRYGAELVCFEERPFRTIPREHAPEAPRLYVADLEAWDLVVNLPKLKVHRTTRLSGAVKNLFGLVPGGAKQRYHDALKRFPDYLERFASLLVEVYLAARPGLNVLDGVVGLGRDGPAATGDPTRTRFLLASRDALALDVALCRVIGEELGAVSYLRDALRRGLIDPDAVELVGRPPRVDFPLLEERGRPSRVQNAFAELLLAQQAMTPRVDPRRCRRCGACVERCQVGALSLAGEVVVSAERCIACYGCPSFCDNGALELRPPPLYPLVRGLRRLTRI